MWIFFFFFCVEGEKSLRFLKMSDSLTIPLLIGGSTILFRLHFYRHLRKILLPLGLISLYFRIKYYNSSSSSSSSNNLLTLITTYLQSHQSIFSSLLSDLLGGYLIYHISFTLSNLWSYSPHHLLSLLQLQGDCYRQNSSV